MRGETVDYYKPIPLDLKGPEGWKEKPIRPLSHGGDDELVALGPWTDYGELYTDKIYGGERISSPYIDSPLTESIVIHVLRRDANRLVKAQKLLPQGLYLAVLDIHRDLETQQALFDRYLTFLKREHSDWTEEVLLTETQKYVSIPSGLPTRPSPHYTGGAVDVTAFKLPPEVDGEVKEIDRRLTHLRRYERFNRMVGRPADFGWQEFFRLDYRRTQLKNRYAQFFDFGTPFDYGGDEAALNYYELLGQKQTLTPTEREARDNRRLLYSVMTAVGYQPYLYEWWHFNAPEIQMGAQTANLSFATRNGKEITPAQRKWELIRKASHTGAVSFWNSQPGSKVGVLNEKALFVYRVILEHWNPEYSSMPAAEAITPKR